jgi:hypothetical protein
MKMRNEEEEEVACGWGMDAVGITEVNVFIGVVTGVGLGVWICH